MRFVVFALASLLSGQDFSETQIEKATGGLHFTEGPLWSRATEALLFCDVPTNTIHAFLPGKGLGKYRENMIGATALAYDHDGKLLVAEARARRIIRLYPGDEAKFDTVAERFEGKRLNGPNDLVVRKDGQIFFTDPAFGAQSDERELDFHGVFHLTPKGELTVIAKPKGRPNGIALSPNGKILYVSNSDERRIYAYDIDGRGNASNERVFLDRIEGVPAGLRTDEKGNLYVAAKNVLIYSPAAGLLHTIFMSDKPSNLAFGESDHMTLFITAKSSVYRARMKVKGAVGE